MNFEVKFDFIICSICLKSIQPIYQRVNTNCKHIICTNCLSTARKLKRCPVWFCPEKRVTKTYQQVQLQDIMDEQVNRIINVSSSPSNGDEFLFPNCSQSRLKLLRWNMHENSQIRPRKIKTFHFLEHIRFSIGHLRTNFKCMETALSFKNDENYQIFAKRVSLFLIHKICTFLSLKIEELLVKPNDFLVERIDWQTVLVFNKTLEKMSLIFLKFEGLEKDSLIRYYIDKIEKILTQNGMEKLQKGMNLFHENEGNLINDIQNKKFEDEDSELEVSKIKKIERILKINISDQLSISKFTHTQKQDCKQSRDLHDNFSQFINCKNDGGIKTEQVYSNKKKSSFEKSNHNLLIQKYEKSKRTETKKNINYPPKVHKKSDSSQTSNFGNTLWPPELPITTLKSIFNMNSSTGKKIKKRSNIVKLNFLKARKNTQKLRKNLTFVKNRNVNFFASFFWFINSSKMILNLKKKAKTNFPDFVTNGPSIIFIRSPQFVGGIFTEKKINRSPNNHLYNTFVFSFRTNRVYEIKTTHIDFILDASRTLKFGSCLFIRFRKLGFPFSFVYPF